PADVQDRAEPPLHLEGVPLISDELEAGHQRVSPAKYLAAWRRMSRSAASSVFSDSRAATRARNAANSAAGEREPDPGEPGSRPNCWESWRSCWPSCGPSMPCRGL